MSVEELDDPRYVQIGKKRAAAICCVSSSEFDRLRREDPKCPKGFKRSDARNATVYFRLSDVYEYSNRLMSEAS